MMIKLIQLLGLFFIFSACVVADFEPKVLNVDYQIHSNNDLKELPQVLLKGARRFKFDPHYVPYSSQCGDKKSCLLLNHDRPATEFSSYNTSSELLEFLKSDQFAQITEGDRVTVALCFKSAPDKCQNTTAFNNWLRLVDDFYLQAQDAPRNIEFILDGDAAPTQSCLYGRWPRWNSVWINSNSPAGAFWTNDQQDDYYRFQVLNNPESQSNWTWMASADVNYGKFSNGTYPYQLWEPDSQQDIQDYINIYHSGSLHLPGYHFAINIDIAMFRVYSARYNESNKVFAPLHRSEQLAAAASPAPASTLPGCETSLSISQPLIEQADGSAAVDTNPLLVSLAPGAFLSATVRSDVVVLSLVEVNRIQFTATSAASTALSQEDSAWLLKGQDGSASPTMVSLVVTSADNGVHYTVLVTNSAGNMVSVVVSTKPSGPAGAASQLTVLSTAEGALPTTLQGAVVFDVVLLPLSECNTQGASACAQTLSSSDASTLALSTIAVAAPSAGTFKTTLISSVALPAPSAGEISSAKLARLDQDESAQTLIFCAQDLHIYAAEVTTSSSPVWSAISVGKHLSVTVAGSGSAQALMVVSDYGYCYNSHEHNTRAYPTVCASTPIPTETVLDYSVGLARHWLEKLRDAVDVEEVNKRSVQESEASSSYLVTSCSDKILHGSFDQGSRPAVALTHSTAPAFLPSSSGEEMYFFLEMHEGIPTSSAVEVHNGVRGRGGGQCGDPIHRDGVVVDAFAVDSWMRTLQRVYPQ